MQPDKPPHILLVEDDVNLGYLLVENIKSKNLDVTLSQNGKAALEEIEKKCIEHRWKLKKPGSKHVPLLRPWPTQSDPLR